MEKSENSVILTFIENSSTFLLHAFTRNGVVNITYVCNLRSRPSIVPHVKLQYPYASNNPRRDGSIGTEMEVFPTS
jgi:hypothetical protein